MKKIHYNNALKLEKKWWATHLVNRQTKEVHVISKITARCGVSNMCCKNEIYCTRLWAWLLIVFAGYNGCRHCWPKKDRS